MADQKVSDLPSLNGADVDAADLLYIIDSSAGSAGSKKITVGQYQLAPVSGGTANGVLYLNGSKVVTTGSDLVFDGSNLGVGTSSPVEKLAVNQGNFYAIRTGGAKLRLADQNNEVSVESSPTGVVSDMIFKTSAATQMTLDSSGNLGLGVTPSAWSNFKAIQINTASNGAVAAPYLQLTSNAYFNGTNWIYTETGAATRFDTRPAGNAGFAWHIANSGTAGNPITFTQAMTLDASGNLLVGTTTASGGRATVNAVANYGDLATGYSLVLGNTPGTGSNSNPINVGVIQFGNPTLTNNDMGRLSVVQENPGASTQSSMRFFTNGGGGNTQTLERARITSGGDLLVGTTTLSDVGNSIFGSSVPGVIHQNNNAAANGFVFTSYRRSSVEIGSVSQNGTTAVLFNTTSDRRLKDNITPAPSASNVIDAIEIVSHDWKSAPDEHVTYGVIAQDLALVAPQAVLQGDDGDEIEKTWGVDYSKLVPMLIKEIQSLRARVAALESA